MKKSIVFASLMMLLIVTTVAAFAAHPKDRPRDPKAIYIYHTYISTNKVEDRDEEISAYTLVKGGDGPIEIRADLLCYGKVVDSFDWQSDPTIVFTPKFPTHPNGTYVLRVSARDGKTEWTEDSHRFLLNRRDIGVVADTKAVRLGQPVHFTLHTTNLPKRSEMVTRVINADTGETVHEEPPVREHEKKQGYIFTPSEPGTYQLVLAASLSQQKTFLAASEPVRVYPPLRAMADATY